MSQDKISSKPSQTGTRAPFGQGHNRDIRLRGKVVASVRGEFLTKQIRGSVHFLRKPYPAIAFDCIVLIQAIEMGARHIAVQDHETGIAYLTDIPTFRRYSIVIDYQNHGVQRALALHRFQTRGPDGQEPYPETLL